MWKMRQGSSGGERCSDSGSDEADRTALAVGEEMVDAVDGTGWCRWRWRGEHVSLYVIRLFHSI